jgi:RNA polymerase primary sigma factor
MRGLKIFNSITNRDSNSIEKYLQQINKIPVQTPEQELECAKKIKNGDQKSLENLIVSNLRFVVSVAKQYHVGGVSLSDLIESGNEGLIIAANKFDHTKGFKFISYAVWWIRQSIIKYIQDNGKVVRVSTNKLTLLTKYKKIEEKYIQQNSEIPTAEYISKKMNLKIHEAEEIQKINSYSYLSLDQKVDEDDDSSINYSDSLIDEDSLFKMEKKLNDDSLKRDLEIYLNSISKREKFVLTKLFNLDGEGDYNLETLSKSMGLSKEMVRQIKVTAFKKLLSKRGIRKLENYL